MRLVGRLGREIAVKRGRCGAHGWSGTAAWPGIRMTSSNRLGEVDAIGWRMAHSGLGWPNGSWRWAAGASATGHYALSPSTRPQGTGAG